MFRAICVSVLLLSGMSVRAAELDPQALAAFASGKAVAIMRHALAPGIGDPAEMDLQDCMTQRNLSEQGRQQALRIGDVLRAQGIDDAAVFSSAWCRCLDTATELRLGKVSVLEPLNSFFQDRSSASPQTEALSRWIEARLEASLDQPAVLVTHQVNISALTGQFARSGELLVLSVDDGTVEVLGSMLIE
jgi:broad specificity phosphatase PhoE